MPQPWTEVKTGSTLAAVKLKPGEWLTGAGWDEGKLAERRYIVASDLDKVAPNNPVWLIHTTGHYGVANHEALRLAHITAAIQGSSGRHHRSRCAGRTHRRAEGGGHGRGRRKLIPPPTPQQWRNGVLRMVDTLHREGMTAVKDPDIEQPIWDAYHQLLKENKLPCTSACCGMAALPSNRHAPALARIQALPRPPNSLGDGNLLSCGAKLYMDGSGGARTAWVYKEWNKNSDRHRPRQLRLSLDRS